MMVKKCLSILLVSVALVLASCASTQTTPEEPVATPIATKPIEEALATEEPLKEEPADGDGGQTGEEDAKDAGEALADAAIICSNGDRVPLSGALAVSDENRIAYD